MPMSGGMTKVDYNKWWDAIPPYPPHFDYWYYVIIYYGLKNVPIIEVVLYFQNMTVDNINIPHAQIISLGLAQCSSKTLNRLLYYLVYRSVKIA